MLAAAGAAAAPDPAPGAGPKAAVEAPVEPPRVDPADDPLFQQRLTLALDGTPLEKVVDRLRQEHKLPVRIAKGLDVAEARLTLRVKEATVGGLLSAIATALGEGYRWKRQGDSVDLLLDARLRWEDAASRDSAEALLRALRAEGLLPPGEVPLHSNWEGGAQADAEIHRLMGLPAALVRALPPELAAAAATEEGIAAGRLPEEIQQRVYEFFTRRSSPVSVMNSLVLGARDLARHPLVSGVAPSGLKVHSKALDGERPVWLVEGLGVAAVLHGWKREGQPGGPVGPWVKY